mmetsp:Transcript_4438/g.12891  ORF Transcript_4438/g.12891 Transcript_4438/m.12891 type:complete len:282 (-) Transcript_4438:138-983(-)
MALTGCHAPGEKEAPLGQIDHRLAHEDFDADQEGEHELVLLEEGSAHVGVERVRHVVIHVGEALLQVVRWLRLPDAVHKELVEPHERVLVHGVDEREVRNREEEHRAAEGHGHVLLARFVDLFLGLLRLREGRLDLLRRHLADAEGVDELRVVKDVALGVGQHEEDLRLQLRELAPVVGTLHHEAVLKLGEVWPLGGDDGAQELLLEPVWCDREVDESHLDLHLGRVVRVRDHRRQREAEVRVVGDDVVPKLDNDGARVVLIRLVEQHRLQEGVQHLQDVL